MVSRILLHKGVGNDSKFINIHAEPKSLTIPDAFRPFSHRNFHNDSLAQLRVEEGGVGRRQGRLSQSSHVQIYTRGPNQHHQLLSH